MIKNNILNEVDIKKIDGDVIAEMDKAMEFAINSPINEESEIFKDVYSESDPLPISLDEKINKILNN
jgi:Pyruvate/2-oxoglutarate dehydrogenase complex, dehydrogenase (E1) component, eukaryotic type, alpha subunit